jgi:error-prone DNA polymerase
MNARSPAACAWDALRELPAPGDFQLIVGAGSAGAAPQLVLLAPEQRAYTQICALITRARRRAPKGSYHLGRADFEQDLDACLALWLPPAEPEIDDARWLRAHFPDRAWVAVELHRGARDAPRLERLTAFAAAHGLPAVAAGDVHMHRRARRRLQDLLTATRHGCTLAAAGARLFPNGERHLRPLAVLERIYPPALLAESLAIAARCRFSCCAALRISRGAGAAGATPARTARTHRRGHAAALARAHPKPRR